VKVGGHSEIGLNDPARGEASMRKRKKQLRNGRQESKDSSKEKGEGELFTRQDTQMARGEVRAVALKEPKSATKKNKTPRGTYKAQTIALSKRRNGRVNSILYKWRKGGASGFQTHPRKKKRNLLFDDPLKETKREEDWPSVRSGSFSKHCVIRIEPVYHCMKRKRESRRKEHGTQWVRQRPAAESRSEA